MLSGNVYTPDWNEKNRDVIENLIISIFRMAMITPCGIMAQADFFHFSWGVESVSEHLF